MSIPIYPVPISDVFQNDPDYLENEQAYETIRDEILGEGVMSGDSESEEEGSEESEEESDEGMCSWLY